MSVREIIKGLCYVIRTAVRGGLAYWSTVLALLILVAYSLYVWVFLQHAPVLLGVDYGGLALTGMSDRVPWGLYTSLFIFWVGIAASSIICALAVYVFGSRETAALVELAKAQACASLAAAILFILVDVGRPLRTLYLMPLMLNPLSVFDWDMVVLISYLLANLVSLLYSLGVKLEGGLVGERARKAYIALAAPLAIAVHTVTAFIFQPLAARPYWNTAILAPEFVATAFASGPALLALSAMVVEKATRLRFNVNAYKLLVRVSVVSTIVALYLSLSEVEEALLYPSHPARQRALRCLLAGCGGAYLAVMEWTWIILALASVLLHLHPKTRASRKLLLVNALLVLLAIVCQKTLPLVVTGFLPLLARGISYTPTPTEAAIALGVHALAGLIYLLLARPAVLVEMEAGRR